MRIHKYSILPCSHELLSIKSHPYSRGFFVRKWCLELANATTGMRFFKSRRHEVTVRVLLRGFFFCCRWSEQFGFSLLLFVNCYPNFSEEIFSLIKVRRLRRQLQYYQIVLFVNNMYFLFWVYVDMSSSFLTGAIVLVLISTHKNWATCHEYTYHRITQNTKMKHDQSVRCLSCNKFIYKLVRCGLQIQMLPTPVIFIRS